MPRRSVGRGRILDEMRQRGLNAADAESALDTTISALSGLLDQGEGVAVPGFGIFKRTFRDTCTRTNPRTGEKVIVQGRFVTKFQEHKPRKR